MVRLSHGLNLRKPPTTGGQHRQNQHVKQGKIHKYYIFILSLFTFTVHRITMSTAYIHVEKASDMQTQWGSCSPKGQLTLNPHLVKAPRDCIDYVLLHELCHVAEHNHSEGFYRLMRQVMPQWEKVKERLDGMAYFYLNDV